MSMTFNNIEDNVKEELNDYFGMVGFDFTEDGELYEFLDQCPRFRNYVFDSIENFTDMVCVWPSFDNYCDCTIDECIETIDDERLRDMIFDCFDYNRYHQIVFSTDDMHELSNGLIVQIFS